MEQLTTIELIKSKTEEMTIDFAKFNKGNDSAGTRTRKYAQELKALLQTLREEVLEKRKTTKND
jgi:hypothetical protein